MQTHFLFRRLLVCAALTVIATAAPVNAIAQGYPDRPITLVIPYTPGGSFDSHGRLVAKHLSTLLGQTVIVENRPGAGTTIGAAHVARAKPDGYTLLMAGGTMLTIAPHTFKSLPYKVEDFQTVSLINIQPMVLYVNPKVLPVKDFKEYVAYAKANPGKMNYATTGPGVATHLLGELMKLSLGIDIVPVHYKGTGPGQVDLLGGQVQSMLDGWPSHAQMVNEGRERALAASSEQRPAPDVPTFAELGYPELSMASWAGIVVPKGTPAPIVEKLQKAVNAAVNNPEVNKKMLAEGTFPLPGTPEAFDALIKKDHEVWGEVIRKIGGLRIN